MELDELWHFLQKNQNGKAYLAAAY
jgi:hypothetical protein